MTRSSALDIYLYIYIYRSGVDIQRIEQVSALGYKE